MNEKRPFGPVIETPPKETSFITAEPLDIIASGEYNKVPVLIGYCKDEGIFTEVILHRVGKEAIHNDFEVLIHHKLSLNKGSETSKGIAGRIKEFYYPGQQATNFDAVQAFYDVRRVSCHLCFV